MRKSLTVIALVILLSVGLSATSVRGTLRSLSTDPLLSGQLEFRLSATNAQGQRVDGCADGSQPKLAGGAGVINELVRPMKAGAGGQVINRIIGNDQIDCGAGVGVGTYYLVRAYDGKGILAWEKIFRVEGGLFDLNTAVPLNSVPPSALPAAVPSSASSPCTPPMWSADVNYFYFCRAKDTWSRFAAAGTW